ncbi:MAG: transketolase [Nitrospirae bacterium]|nr:transketolase [Nitrospirota bacterium]
MVAQSIGQSKTMRDAFIERLYDKMAQNDDIFFLAADFGSPALDRVRADFPDRFINVGIAEQNLINIATGLALEGCTVYAYAIAPFLTMRAYEQIRVNLSLFSELKHLNVNLIGVGAGLSYDVSGPTHHCVEDISIMRLLPNFHVLSPSDWKMAATFADYTTAHKCPKYLRFDGKPAQPLYDDTSTIDVSKGFCELVAGDRVCLVSTGFMTRRALKALDGLRDINPGLIDMFMLKPVRDDVLFDVLRRYETVITIEEGFINNGGLDSLVANVINGRQSGIRVRKLGFNDKYVFELGDRQHLHALNGIDEDGIVREVRLCVQK